MTQTQRLAIALSAVAILVGLLVSRALFPPRPGTGRIPLGLNNNAVIEGVATPDRAAALLATVGAQIDRVQVGWRALEPRPGVYVWRSYDAIYNADLAHHVRPLFVFGFAPQWAADPSCVATVSLCPPAPNQIHAAATAAALLARRYPRAAGIEIWNEPNTPGFWFPRADPRAYTRLLIACYEEIKTVNSRMAIAGGSISNSPAFDSSYVALPDFLRAIYRLGGGDAMDAISIHAYPDPGDISGSTALSAVQSALAVRNMAGDRRTPLWITETGISSSGPGAVDEFEQAAALVNLYAILSRIHDVKMVVIHTLIPPPNQRDPRGFAIVRANFDPKPAFCALAAAVGADRRC